MTSTDTDSNDAELSRAFAALHREMHALYGVVARRFELTVQQIELLCLLGHERPSLGELAGLLGCDKTNVTGMVDRLGRRSLLMRETDSTDRRVIRVVLTDQGASLRADIRAALDKELAARLPRANRAQLAALASDAASALADNR